MTRVAIALFAGLWAQLLSADGPPVDVLARDASGAPTSVPAELTLEVGGMAVAIAARSQPPLSLVVVVDRTQIDDERLAKTVTALAAWADGLGESDTMLLASYGGEMRILSRFGAGREDLKRAIGRLGLEKTLGASKRTLRRSRILEIRDAGLRAGDSARDWADRVSEETRSFLVSLAELLHWQRGQPGRRAFVVLSGGFELRPGDEMARAAAAVSRGNALVDQSLVPLLLSGFDSTALAMESAVFAIDVSGLADSSRLADALGIPRSSGMSAIGLRRNFVDGLEALVGRSGGFAVTDATEPAEAIARVRQALAGGVRLESAALEALPARSVAPILVRDGSGAGVALSYPAFRIGTSADEREELAIEARLALDGGAGDFVVRGRIHPTAGGDPQLEVDVLAKSFAWADEAGGAVARADIFVLALGDDGFRSQFHRLDWETRVARRPEGWLRYRTPLDTRARETSLRIAVRDRASGRIGYGSAAK